jgi:hypothetical protein
MIGTTARILSRWKVLYAASVASAALGLGTTATEAVAQGATQPRAPGTDYPSRPARVIMAFAPGGNPDITARLISGALSAQTGQQSVAERRLHDLRRRALHPRARPWPLQGPAGPCVDRAREHQGHRPRAIDARAQARATDEGADGVPRPAGVRARALPVLRLGEQRRDRPHRRGAAAALARRRGQAHPPPRPRSAQGITTRIRWPAQADLLRELQPGGRVARTRLRPSDEE